MQKTAESGARSQIVTGITLMAIGVAFLAVNDAFAKALTGQGYLPVQILFVRNILALPIAAAIAWKMGGVAALKTRKPVPHLVRGAIWVAATIFFFTAVSLLELAEATAVRRVAIHDFLGRLWRAPSALFAARPPRRTAIRARR